MGIQTVARVNLEAFQDPINDRVYWKTYAYDLKGDHIGGASQYTTPQKALEAWSQHMAKHDMIYA